MPWVAVDIGEVAGTSVINVPDHISPADQERGFLVEFGAKDGETIVVGLYRWQDGVVAREKHPQLLIASPEVWPNNRTPPEDPFLQETR
jgi:hypothetical protein